MKVEFDEQTSLQIQFLAERAKMPPEEVVLMAVQLQTVIYSKYTTAEVLAFLQAREQKLTP